MADRTPRIYYLNRILDAGVVLTASSSDLPVRGPFTLLDPTPTRRWRSKLGWNVAPPFNDKIYFLEGASSRVATIATGNYPSGIAVIQAVATAMTNAPGAVNVYTGTYVGSFFSIARQSGASTVTLQFGVANQDSFHQDLGFDNATLGPFTTVPQVAGNQSFKSREWIKLDHASNFDVRAAILYGINFDPALTSNLMKAYYQQAATDSWENHAPAIGDELAGDEKLRLLIANRSLDTKRWGRYLIKDVSTNQTGYSEVGIAYAGDYLEPSRGVRQGWRQRQGQLSSFATGDTGSVFVDLKPSPRSYEIELARVSRTDRNNLAAFANVVRLGGSFFYAFDPLNFPGLDTLYVYLTEELVFTQRVGDGNPPDRFDVAGFSMTEHL